jgi:hypothetical protein
MVKIDRWAAVDVVTDAPSTVVPHMGLFHSAAVLISAIYTYEVSGTVMPRESHPMRS